MAYDKTRPIPPGYHVYSEMRTELVIAGGIAFWGSYLPSYAIGWVGVRRACELQGEPFYCEAGRGYFPLNFPFAGPFVALYTLDVSAAEGAGLVALGTLQIAGAAITIAGLVAKKKYLIRDASIKNVTIGPRVLGGSLGIGVSGSM